MRSWVCVPHNIDLQADTLGARELYNGGELEEVSMVALETRVMVKLLSYAKVSEELEVEVRNGWEN